MIIVIINITLFPTSQSLQFNTKLRIIFILSFNVIQCDQYSILNAIKIQIQKDKHTKYTTETKTLDSKNSQIYNYFNSPP